MRGVPSLPLVQGVHLIGLKGVMGFLDQSSNRVRQNLSNPRFLLTVFKIETNGYYQIPEAGS